MSPCPSTSPYFDGTKCIACPQNQLFSITIKTCQTCPSDTIYSTSTFHCEPVHYYTSLSTSDQWLSVQKTKDQLLQQEKQNASVSNSKPCPPEKPFFNGAQCIACAAPTPLFSFDSGACASCVNGTVFSSNLHSCVFAQQMQTNLNSPNLVLDGHPLN